MTQNQELLEAYIKEAKRATEALEAVNNQIELVRIEVEKENEVVRAKEVAAHAKKFTTKKGLGELAIGLLKDLIEADFEVETSEEIELDIEGEYVSFYKDLTIYADAYEVLPNMDEISKVLEAFEKLSDK